MLPHRSGRINEEAFIVVDDIRRHEGDDDENQGLELHPLERARPRTAVEHAYPRLKFHSSDASPLIFSLPRAAPETTRRAAAERRLAAGPPGSPFRPDRGSG